MWELMHCHALPCLFTLREQPRPMSGEVRGHDLKMFSTEMLGTGTRVGSTQPLRSRREAAWTR